MSSAAMRLSVPNSERYARENLVSIRDALDAGDLSGAQCALAKIVGATGPSTWRKDWHLLEQSLKSGDLALAQQAFAKIQQQMLGGACPGIPSDSSWNEESPFDVMA